MKILVRQKSLIDLELLNILIDLISQTPFSGLNYKICLNVVFSKIFMLIVLDFQHFNHLCPFNKSKFNIY